MRMGVVTRAAKKRRLEEEDRLKDHISGLPDAVLSSRWRHIWRSAPLNVNLHGGCDPTGAVRRILSSHRVPGRRFSVVSMGHWWRREDAAATLEVWLRSPALNNLEELEFHFHLGFSYSKVPPPPLPASVHRFSSTLRAASFGGCSIAIADGDAAVPLLHLPLLKQLSLLNARISGSSLHALLAGCPVLESLLLLENHGCPRAQIVSPSLRSIGLCSGRQGLSRLQHLNIEDAPCLERLLFFTDVDMDISVISAPRLAILGKLSSKFPRLQFGTTAGFQKAMVSSVKVLAIPDGKLRLDAVINLMKCFPSLEKLYIKTGHVGKRNVWHLKHRNLIGTLDIRLKKIVFADYLGNKSHVSFAKFFVMNASMLESMTLQLKHRHIDNDVWIRSQHIYAAPD
ncbi:hypothetical protein C2845_PM03G18500 [Panicum miliaceum]|uniref:Uncharacterized protein n=1 Tax=Panicum miliaceum TaxID=4540 RepID=A0A3L6T8Z7_PANMI|nr:hypothetical protein C2845_PM03G18500 [Panicum miliaceum]